MEQVVNSLIGETFNQQSADMVLRDAKKNAEVDDEGIE